MSGVSASSERQAWGAALRLVGAIGGVMVAVAAAAPARADLYATGGEPPTGGVPLVGQFDATGRLVRTSSGLVESTDAIILGSDGWLYGAGNALGAGYLARARPGGPLDWQRLTPFAGNTPYAGPGGLAAGPDGSIYAASGFFGVFLNGQRGVFRYNPANGSFALFAPASDPQSGQTGGLGALARSPSGDLYVARSGMGIERYSGATGASLGVIIPASPPGIFTRDLEFGPDANLYIPSAQGVDRFNPQTGAALGPFITGLPGVSEMSFGGDGLLYLNVPSAHQVVRYDAASGAFRDVFVSAEQYDLFTGRTGYMGDIVYVSPEPETVAVLTTGAGLLGLRRRRRGRSE